MIALQVAFALFLDFIFKEPKRFHPLVGFGNLALKIESVLNQGSHLRLKGFLAVLIVQLPWLILAVLLEHYLSSWFLIVLSSCVLYLAIGWQSLILHAKPIQASLEDKDLNQARYALSMIVSRDTSLLSEKDISKAATESVLENGADAIFAAIFWFVLLGIPGVVLYRLSNTLDAMWGYKNERFLVFGWFAARLDDVLNFVPARLTALSYSVCGDFKTSIRCLRQQGFNWKSPNAGPVMSAGAGAINTSLGGEAVYHGQSQLRPLLGPEETVLTQACSASIAAAVELVNRSLMLWLLMITVFSILLMLFRFFCV